MNRTARVIIGIAGLQLALVGVYLFVEHRRGSSRASQSELSTAPPRRIDQEMKPLWLKSSDGEVFKMDATKGPTLLHFWATWCPPCRTELPGLLELPGEHPVDVVAVALDEEWTDVERFLSGQHYPNVFLGDSSEIESTFNVGSLPVTYLVAPGGQLRLRFDGARDWTDKRFLSRWLDVTTQDATTAQGGP